MQVSRTARAVTTEAGKTILEVAGRPFFELNSIAATIWAELSKGLSTDEIISRLTSQFNAPKERVAKDVNTFVETLKKSNLVKESVSTQDFHAELVWNKGIASRCDWRIPDEFPVGMGFGTVLDPVGHIAPPHLLSDLIPKPEVYTEIKDGELVWVRSSWLSSFLRQALPLIKAKFVLVTGDSDLSVPTAIMAEALEILECPGVLHWYAQNCEGPGFMGRMSPIPIGIDFHTLSERPLWGESMASPREQEELLKSIRGEFRSVRERTRKVYIDFAWQPCHLYHPSRRQRVLASVLKNECVSFQSKPLPRRQLWQTWGEYAFVLSPHGIGLDCHRTWEALACGNIVLVPSSPLDCLYEGLPVVSISNWNDITDRNLGSWLDCYPVCPIDEDKLSSSYWVDKMRAMANAKVGSDR